MAPNPDRVATPIDLFLRRQQDLSAVERFSSLHDADTVDLHAGWYRSLLPATPPGPGQQYRFEVDLDACTACKSCVSACVSLNGLDTGEAWRTVGTVAGLDSTGPTQQTVTAACHHCLDPACLNGCPVDAYDKDPVTGIVAHLDDQCIGCGYCAWTCPYDVPVMNDRLGVVRKCDLCRDRLAEGEAPACVQACPNGAITVGVVDVEELRATITPSDRLVPGAPSSALTVPTTAYHRSAPLADDAAADDHWVATPNHAHHPLTTMLVVTQLGTGLLVGAAVVTATGAAAPIGAGAATTLAAVCTLGGIGASIAHLGRPIGAWKALLGIRRSWLSREIAAFGLLAPVTVAVAAGLVPSAVGAAVGVGAVGCSAMIYIATGRRWWSAARTAGAFTRTVLVGAAAVGGVTLVPALGVAELIDQLRQSRTGDDADLARGVRIERGPLRRLGTTRTAARAVAAGLGVLSLAVPAAAYGALGAAAVGEFAARTVFFRAMTAPRLPGKASS